MQTIKHYDNNLVMVKNADIVTEMVSQDGKPRLQITVADQFTSLASPRSVWNETACQYDDEIVRAKLQGGSFFINSQSGQIIASQYRDYEGFEHDDKNINALIHHIGTSDLKSKRGTAVHNKTGELLQLSTVLSTVEMNVPFLPTGGDFNSELSFVWSPFQSHVKASYRLVRLICTNGMVGMGDFMNCKIPLVNDWTEHLQIANKQIQNKVGDMLTARVSVMSNDRASVRDCQRVVESAVERLKSPNCSNADSNRLHDIIDICDPQIHLVDHYNQSVFTDRRLSDQARSHLTQFTLWNMITEMATHTSPTDRSTALAVQKHANAVFFPQNMFNKQTNSTQKLAVRYDDLDAAFSNDLLVA